MRPEICSFISNAFYDGRLTHEQFTETRSIHLSKPCTYLRRSSGLLYVPVEHEGNTYESDEEAETVRKIVAELIGQTLEQAGQRPRLISADDILVVAPFNLQVRKLRTALPGVRVGTVDKFQGQQAPVVIFSMTASEGDASPRGMDFCLIRTGSMSPSPGHRYSLLLSPAGSWSGRDAENWSRSNS
jgi:superfamily I DNA and/or RNA helicase